MENNFYVGIVYHNKRIFKGEYKEKMVLYSEDGLSYLDLINGIVYNSDINDKDYVLKDSLIPTDIKEYKIDYMYLLSKYKKGCFVKKKNLSL